MLSRETEERICKILMNISEAELKCEIARKNLCQTDKFDPNRIFRKLDIKKKNNINENDIIDFLQSNSIYCNEKEAKFLINFYDCDLSDSLNYSEFLNMIIENDDYPLEKIENKLDSSINLSYQIEFALCRIFEREINLIRILNNILNEMKQRWDFSVFDIYYLLKNENNEITNFTISQFLRKHNFNFNQDDIMRILKRFDVNRDNHITVEDIQKLFGIETSYPCYKNQKEVNFSKEYDYINTNYPHNIFTKGNFLTMYKAKKSDFLNETLHNKTMNFSSLNISSINVSAIEEQKNQNLFSKKKVSDNLTLTQVPLRKKVKIIKYNEHLSDCFKMQYNISSNSEDINSERIVQFLKLIMNCELQIEKAKIELSKRADFNIDDVFRFFEPKHFEYITESDLKLCLAKLKIITTDEEIKLLLMKYDLNNNGVYEFEDFFDMFVPFDREYRSLIEKRLPLPFDGKFNDEKYLCDISLKYMKNLLNIMIKTESKIEDERHKLNRNYNLNIRKFFDQIDKSKKGSFGIMDLKYYFKDNDIETLPKEIDLLFIRLDRKRKGQVDYFTFLMEIVNRVDKTKSI